MVLLQMNTGHETRNLPFKEQKPHFATTSEEAETTTKQSNLNVLEQDVDHKGDRL